MARCGAIVKDDDDFEPRLGRQRGRDGAARYASRVVVAAGLVAASVTPRSRRFDGSRIGRGAAIGRLLSSRDRLEGLRGRRAVVKTRLVRLGPRGTGAAKAHLRYIQRDGVTREGAPGELYGADADRADGKAFLEHCGDDRHQFRFIVSLEDGDQYRDLKPFTRRLMAQMEQDLGTRLDWVAVDHFNTGHPHTHVVLRGVDDRGRNLVIARDYIAHGLRERAAELATLDLGPRTTREIETRLRHDVDQERLTAIDRRLIARSDETGLVAPRANDPFFHALEAGRLRVLERMALAEDLGGGNWRLAGGLEVTLRAMGERNDIIRLMQREMTRARLAREHRIHAPAAGPLIGRVIMRGLADEHRDRHYLLVDGSDGLGHYVDIGAARSVEPLPDGALVRIVANSGGARDVDRAVAAVAAANGGRYSEALHLRHDPSATEAFARAHVRRLEAMRRAGAEVAREPDGGWRISPDHIGEAERFEARRLRDSPVAVQLLSSIPVERLAATDGATWLDRELVSGAPAAVREAGFGSVLRQALDTRRSWLVERGLASFEADGFRPGAAMVETLRRRELLRVAAQLETELGKPFLEMPAGSHVEGKVARRIDMVSGRFALIETSRSFTLVPWQPVLEARIGRDASGIMREAGISWRFGRARGGPEIG